jgi:hypothetical protein
MIVPSSLGGSGLTTLDNGLPATRCPAANGASRIGAAESPSRRAPFQHAAP